MPLSSTPRTLPNFVSATIEAPSARPGRAHATAAVAMAPCFRKSRRDGNAFILSSLSPGKRASFRFGLCIGERSEFGGDAACNRGHLASGLEAGEVRSIAPRDRSAEADTGLEGRVVHDVDRALVVGRSLPEAR